MIGTCYAMTHRAINTHERKTCEVKQLLLWEKISRPPNKTNIRPERPRKTKVTFCMHGKRSRYIFRRGCETKQTKPTESGIHTDVTQTRGQSHEAGLEGLAAHVKQHTTQRSVTWGRPRGSCLACQKIKIRTTSVMHQGRQILTWHRLEVSHTRPTYRVLSRMSI